MSKVIIFDTETTGLEKEDKIIQIGAIIIDTETNKLYGRGVYNELCSCDTFIKLKAMSTHGIREEDIRDKSIFKETEFYKVLNELNNEENYLIAHNLPFDLGMLEKEGFQNKYRLIDTLQCSMHLFKASCDEEAILDGQNRLVPDFQLQSFRYKLFKEKDEQLEIDKYNGIEIKAHDAIGDVIILKLFLYKLYEFAQNKQPNINFDKFLNLMMKLTQKDAELEIITYGKYKCKTFKEIFADKKVNKYGKLEGKSYLKWMLDEELKKGDDANRNLQYTLQKFLNKLDR